MTLTPLLFVGTATETAGWQLITNTFIPKMINSGKPGLVFQGWLLSSIAGLAMVALVAILVEAIGKWQKNWRKGEAVAEAASA